MNASFFVIAAILVNGGISAQVSHQDPPGKRPEHAIHVPSQIKWQIGPASLPPGAKLALLEGDPGRDGFFTIRIWMPDGYRIPPHTHPKVEHVTVISGIFNFGMGEKFDQAATQPLPTGTFGFWPAGMKHFAWAKGETVVQLHGVGPWEINYLNPDDDPRKAKESGKRLRDGAQVN